MSGLNVPPEARVACAHCAEQHPAAYTHCPNTGKPLSVGSALVGRIIAGRYRIVGQLGEGGMGEVFVAEHLLIGRKVAIKRLHPELAADERAVQRFQREARAAAATGHEHIVEVLDLGYADDHAPYLVMEYLRGQPLSQLLQREKRLAPQRACLLMGQVLAALEAVHQQEIVHRDLKPDNVFITRRAGVGEFVKVLDFGISKMKEENGETLQLTRTGMMMGTPFYMSPEQARGTREVDHRVDLYAVGVMLYECLTGRLPYASDNYHALLQQILRTEPRPPSELAPNIDPALDAVVIRSLGKDPALRFATAAEFGAALQPFGGLSSSPVPGAAVAARSAPSPSSVIEASVGEAFVGPRPTLGSVAEARRATPRYYFAASDDWQPERARTGARRPLGPPSPREGADGDEAERPRSPTPPNPPAQGKELAQSAVAMGRASTSSMAMAPPSRATQSAPGSASTAVHSPAPVTPLLDVPSGSLHTEAAVRGSWFVATLEYLGTMGGPAELEAVMKRMPPAAAERVDAVILPMAWLPMATFELLVRAAGEGEAVLQSIGRAIADRELATTHRLFVQTGTPKSALERFPHLFRLYHLRGTATIEEGDVPGNVRITLDTGAPESLVHTHVVAAFVQRLLEICGARDVRTVVLSVRGRGEARTVLSCRFKLT